MSIKDNPKYNRDHQRNKRITEHRLRLSYESTFHFASVVSGDDEVQNVFQHKRSELEGNRGAGVRVSTKLFVK